MLGSDWRKQPAVAGLGGMALEVLMVGGAWSFVRRTVLTTETGRRPLRDRFGMVLDELSQSHVPTTGMRSDRWTLEQHCRLNTIAHCGENDGPKLVPKEEDIGSDESQLGQARPAETLPNDGP